MKTKGLAGIFLTAVIAVAMNVGAGSVFHAMLAITVLKIMMNN